MKETLQPGIEHEFTIRITDSKTVPALYPESSEFQVMPEVFATGYMIGFMPIRLTQNRRILRDLRDHRPDHRTDIQTSKGLPDSARWRVQAASSGKGR